MRARIRAREDGEEKFRNLSGIDLRRGFAPLSCFEYSSVEYCNVHASIPVKYTYARVCLYICVRVCARARVNLLLLLPIYSLVRVANRDWFPFAGLRDETLSILGIVAFSIRGTPLLFLSIYLHMYMCFSFSFTQMGKARN